MRRALLAALALGACSDGPAAAGYAKRYCERFCIDGGATNARCKSCPDAGPGGEGGASGGGTGGGFVATGGGSGGGGGAGGTGGAAPPKLTLRGLGAGTDVTTCLAARLTLEDAQGQEIFATETIPVNLAAAGMQISDTPGCVGAVLAVNLEPGGSALFLQPLTVGGHAILLTSPSPLVSPGIADLDSFAQARGTLGFQTDGGPCITLGVDGIDPAGQQVVYADGAARELTLETADGGALVRFLDSTCSTIVTQPFIASDTVNVLRPAANELHLSGRWHRRLRIDIRADAGTLVTDGGTCSLGANCRSRLCGERGCLCMPAGGVCSFFADACCQTCALPAGGCIP